MRLSRFILGVGLELAFFAASCWAQPLSERVVIDARAPGRPFPHFWEQTFGSGRAILTLRESYRSDLREVKKSLSSGTSAFTTSCMTKLGYTTKTIGEREIGWNPPLRRTTRLAIG
jgi:xylan 1,4-beta-xylosidase